MDRFEWFLEKATEIGVDRITPVFTQRTERDKIRHDRMEKVLVGAMKQSQRKWLPQLDELIKLKELAVTTCPQKFFGWCEGDHADLTSAYEPKLDALVLIGPEGDFTPEEAELLLANGFQPVSLGKARLRTETAAIAACTWMNFAQR
jgi:16S rRNA (uracil1498-N3)-methyltransferase